jgi:hypothetical protein
LFARLKPVWIASITGAKMTSAGSRNYAASAASPSPFSRDGLDNHQSLSSLNSNMTTRCGGASPLVSAVSPSSFSGVTSMVSSE